MKAVVLVVDFEQRSAAATKAMLEPLGCDVVIAGSTKDLESFLAKDVPAAVVLEPMLPGLDGFRFIKGLKSRKGGRVPVVITASRIFKGQRYKTMGKEAGADLVLERPADDPVMLATVQKAIEQSQADGPSGPVSGPVRPGSEAGTFPVQVQGYRATGQTPVTPAPAAPATVTATGKRAGAAVIPQGEPELDQLVDQMFESCFENAASAPVAEPAGRTATAVAPPPPAVAPAPAAPPKKGGRMDSGTHEMLSSLEQIESSLPASPKAKGGRREVETKVPLAPPPRPEDERSLDEMLDKITGVVPPAAAPAPAADTSFRSFGGMMAEPDSGSKAGGLSPAIKFGVPAAAVVLLAVVAFMFMGGKSETPSTPDGTTAPVEGAATTPDGSAAPTPDPAGATTDPAAATTPAPATTAQPAGPRTAAAPAPTAPATAPKPADAKKPPVQTAATTTPAPAPAQQPAKPTTPTPAPTTTTTAAATPPPAAPTPEPAPAPAPEVAAAPVQAPVAPANVPRVASAPATTTIIGVNTSTEPVLVSKVEPRYPAFARQRGIKGDVKLEIVILKDGSIGNVRILTEPPGSGLGNAAADAVKKWKYRPAMESGRPVEKLRVVTVAFN